MKVISWRNAIQKAKLEPTTKLVLFNLSVHMNDAGESCFPSIELQCQYTGLSNRAVITHLKKAEEAGFITKSKHGYGDQRWARNEYVATFPPEAELDKAVNDVHDNSEKGSERRSKGSERSDIKAVNVVHTNMTNITLQEQDHNTYVQKLFSDDFEVFWEKYPRQRRGNKVKAWNAFRAASGRSTFAEIMDGLGRYQTSNEVNQGYAKGAAAWLNDDRWEVDYSIQPKGGNNGGYSNGSGSGARAFQSDADKREFERIATTQRMLEDMPSIRDILSSEKG